MSIEQHMSAESAFEKDGTGFYVPTCACGWAFGPVPDLETLVDVLMQHAYEAAVGEGGTRRGTG